MSLQTGQIQETPGAPQVDAYPHLSFGVINQTVAIGASAFVFQQIGGATATGNEWVIGATPLIEGHILAGNAAGGALEILLSLDGITFDSHDRIWLPGLQVTFFGPIEAVGYIARFRLWNDDAAAVQLFQGLITMKGF